MHHTAVLSAVIKSVGYDPGTRTLEVEFEESGFYRYLRVPRFVYKDLLNASSKGQYFDAHIRGAYPYQKT